MANHISWYVNLKVKPGKLQELQSLTEAMVESTRDEAGALIYERFVGEEGTDVYIYERYADSRAAVEHLLSFQETFGERFSSLVNRKQFVVFGNPSQELKEVLVQFGATFASPIAGFAK